MRTNDAWSPCSGVRMYFDFTRRIGFLSKTYVGTSIILVILSYITFWIDKNRAPARTAFCVTNFLNAVYLQIQSNNSIPTVPYLTWLQNFLIWDLIFIFIPILQYTILNASSVYFEKTKKEIEKLENEVLAYA